MIITIIVTASILYILIGFWFKVFFMTKGNEEFKNIPCNDKDVCNHLNGPNGPNKDWDCSDSPYRIAVPITPMFWPFIVIYFFIIEPSATYFAKELTNPKENI